jgi:hypothetical protein
MEVWRLHFSWRPCMFFKYSVAVGFKLKISRSIVVCHISCTVS